ncbi:MotA/TolQ/ExbB proton channel family protein [Thiohalospira sp.]|uniref:MotA/TolQ/ExbB proton channel family protein n=1 Tax=Thiohalospira sp. TaxID=3080549 RepID=UPI00397F165E
MFESNLVFALHGFVGWLLEPVLAGLAVVVLVAGWEVGTAGGERLALARRTPTDAGALATTGRRRIDRADLLARLGPMLGLMGTLIPLGPGLAALGDGDLTQLARAVRVAFDTTVVGLLVGVAGFLLGRLRRRWYDEALDRAEASGEDRP